MSDSCENVLETELESLEAIYVNELTYSRNTDGTVNKIELLLHPATGHDIAKRYVCMTLVFTLGPQYPHEPPDIEIRNPRGLGEEEISSLREDMILRADTMRGDAMLYTLIEMTKDSLTDGNIPRCPCVVCLEPFHDADSFHRTECYHYLHTQCLYKYIVHTRAQIEEEEKEFSERRHMESSNCDKNKAKQIMCPVCRSVLDDESLAVTCSSEDLQENEKTEKFVMPLSLKEQQIKMAQLYERQKAKGGIIDPELERNKYLVNPEDRMPIRNFISASVSEAATDRDQTRKEAGGRNKDKSRSSTRQDSSSQQYRNKGRNREIEYYYTGRASGEKKLDRHNKSTSASRTVDSNERQKTDYSVDRERGAYSHGRGRYMGGSQQKYDVQDKSDNILQNEESRTKRKEDTERQVHYLSSQQEYNSLDRFSNSTNEVYSRADTSVKDRRNNERYKNTSENSWRNKTVEAEEGVDQRYERGIDKQFERGFDHSKPGFSQRAERGFDQRSEHCFDHDDEYKRDDFTGQHTMRRYYDSKERSDYQSGGSGHQGRGSGSRYKGSKFNDRRGGYTEQSGRSHFRNDSYNHSHQYHHQPRHHDNRYGEERERTDRQPRDIADNARSAEDNQEPGINTRSTRGTDTSSETGAQDDEEADLMQQIGDSSRWQTYNTRCLARNSDVMDRSTHVECLNVPGTNMKEHALTERHYDTACEASRFQRYVYKMNVHEPKQDLQKNIDDKFNKEGTKGAFGYPMCRQGEMYLDDAVYDDDENWDDEIDIYEYERYKIRPQHHDDYCKQAAPRRKYYQDKMTERYEEQRMINEEFRRIAKEKGLNSNAIDKSSSQEIMVTCQEKGKSQEKSILESFKEKQAKDREISQNYLKEENAVLMKDYTNLLEPVETFVASDVRRLTSLEQNIFSSSHAVESCIVPCHGFSAGHNKSSKTYQKDVDQIGCLGKSQPISHNGRDHVFSATNPEHAVTEDDQQLQFTVVQKSGDCCTGQSKKIPIGITKDISHISFHTTTPRNDTTRTTGKCLSSSLVKDKGTIHKDGEIVHTDNGTLYKGIGSVDHRGADTIHRNNETSNKENVNVLKDNSKIIPQSFIKNFRKIPPLKFPKKNYQGVLWNKNHKEMCHILNQNIPLQATSIDVLDNFLSASISDLSAALLSSYATSCLISTNLNLLTSYQSDFGLNPNLLSTYNTCIENAGDLCQNSSNVQN